MLISSNIKNFKYSWVWEKSKSTGFLNSKKRPLVAHEDVLVFYEKQCLYNPQMTDGKPYDKGDILRTAKVYGGQKETRGINTDGKRYPRSVQYFKTAESEGRGEVIHPTQKPLSLFEYLIKTYTNEGDLVMDNCMGSGTTAVACLNTNRNYIGFENDDIYYKSLTARIERKIR